MSRAGRLLELLQHLRAHRRPVSGRTLAGELGISLRTLYRDIEVLKVQGAAIEGEAGLGFVLRPGFLLPPLMLTPDEIEAVLLGSRWVATRGDAPLSAAARSALAKIGAVLPADLRGQLDDSGLLVPPGAPVTSDTIDLAPVRLAMRSEHKLRLAYPDATGTATERIVWPVVLGFFDHVRVLAAWCELRADFRHFRADRMQALEMLPDRLPRRRRTLLKEWREREGLGPPARNS